MGNKPSCKACHAEVEKVDSLTKCQSHHCTDRPYVCTSCGFISRRNAKVLICIPCSKQEKYDLEQRDLRQVQ